MMLGGPDATALVGLGGICTLFLVTLGPFKILGPFVRLTRETDEATMRRIAVRAAAMRIAFPTVVTPYGIAAVIVTLANSPDAARTAGLLALLLAVMVLNLLAMLFARRIMGGITIMVLADSGHGPGRAPGGTGHRADPARAARLEDRAGVSALARPARHV
jgi:small neutral amino acid transporter SnatA (MarC family)